MISKKFKPKSSGIFIMVYKPVTVTGQTGNCFIPTLKSILQNRPSSTVKSCGTCIKRGAKHFSWVVSVLSPPERFLLDLHKKMVEI